MDDSLVSPNGICSLSYCTGPFLAKILPRFDRMNGAASVSTAEFSRADGDDQSPSFPKRSLAFLSFYIFFSIYLSSVILTYCSLTEFFLPCELRC